MNIARNEYCVNAVAGLLFLPRCFSRAEADAVNEINELVK